MHALKKIKEYWIDYSKFSEEIREFKESIDWVEISHSIKELKAKVSYLMESRLQNLDNMRGDSLSHNENFKKESMIEHKGILN